MENAYVNIHISKKIDNVLDVIKQYMIVKLAHKMENNVMNVKVKIEHQIKIIQNVFV
jgi:hypothetical protein